MEKRTGESPIPKDIHNYLNDAQQKMLESIEHFGWSLLYIRRPLYQEPIVIAGNSSGDAIGVLESDGTFNTHSDITLRAEH